MDKLISLFPDQLLEALKIGQNFAFTKPSVNFKNVVISGLGGSGIGGTIVRDYVTPFLNVPLIVNKSYNLPAFVDNNTLVITCSYSGNTEETLSAFEQALKKNAFVVCISSGGSLSELAARYFAPLFLEPSGRPPRACLGYSITGILFSLYYAGLISNEFIEEINKAVYLLHENEAGIRETASKIAEGIVGKISAIYVGDQMEGIATRWRQQINENGKMVGWENVIPEMNHNELVGWNGHDDYKGLVACFLKSDYDTRRIRTRQDLSLDILGKKGCRVFEVEALGKGYWSEAISLIHIGDWVSWYLSQLRQVDAMDVGVIDYLKAELAKR